ncbi:MAG: glycosyltransferase family 39 protein [Flavobacteriales bacterium]|nr:glycosyltransferase family 39 protein [Flavobacteriales bacterium]
MQFKSWLTDIRFWIGVTFIHRLITIVQPPLEVAHIWRQTMMCMVARNFYEIDANIFYPRLDMPGDLPGITGMEFPFLNYLIYLVSIPFGYDHWYGRLINLIVSSIGIWSFHRYISQLFSKKVAFYSAFLLLFSIYYYYSRKVMTDTFSVSLVIIGMTLWLEYLDHRKWIGFGVGFALITLGVLGKLPVVVALSLLWPTFLKAGRSDRWLIVAATSLVGIIAGVWYYAWVPYLQETFQLDRYFMGASMSETTQFILAHKFRVASVFFQKAMGWTGFGVFIAGLFFVRRKDWNLLAVFGLGTALILLVLLKSGDRFMDHPYYVIPFVPVMVLVASSALERMRPIVLFIAMLAVATEGVVSRWEDQFIKNGAAIVDLEQRLEPFVGKDETIVVNSQEIPAPLYFAHRRGWVDWNGSLLDAEVRQSLASRGCDFIVILKQRFGKEVRLNLPLIYEDELFLLYPIE